MWRPTSASSLHDTVEDTSIGIDQIRKEFGEEVACCVAGVTKIGKWQFYSREDRPAESVSKTRALASLSWDRQEHIAQASIKAAEDRAPHYCHAALGVIHSECQPIPGRIKDLSPALKDGRARHNAGEWRAGRQADIYGRGPPAQRSPISN